MTEAFRHLKAEGRLGGHDTWESNQPSAVAFRRANCRTQSIVSAVLLASNACVSAAALQHHTRPGPGGMGRGGRAGPGAPGRVGPVDGRQTAADRHTPARAVGTQRREAFVPLTYRPGDLAEVDFFEVLVDVVGRAARRGCS